MDKGSNVEMRQERYLQIVAAYGADPKNWPAAERAAALAFAESAGAPSLRDELALDAVLTAYATAQPAGDDEAAMARILTAMQQAAPAGNAPGSVVQFKPRRAAPKTSTSWFGGRGMMAAGFAAAAMLGVVIGANTNVTGAGETSVTGVTTADASSEAFVSYALAEG